MKSPGGSDWINVKPAINTPEQIELVPFLCVYHVMLTSLALLNVLLLYNTDISSVQYDVLQYVESVNKS